MKDGFEVETELTGESARDLNRRLLSEMRNAERRTRLRAEWTADGVTERFFDYVPKGEKYPHLNPKGTMELIFRLPDKVCFND